MAGESEQSKEPINPNALNWDENNFDDSLEKLFKFTVDKAEGSIGWYATKKASKRHGARITRVTAIVAGAIGGIWPVISQISNSDNNAFMDFLFNPAWATVFIAVATAALLLDKFFGFSTAWIRYITSQMKIQYLLEKFEYDWMEERASWKGQKPDYAQVKK